jgi:hypothetical protein
MGAQADTRRHLWSSVTSGQETESNTRVPLDKSRLSVTHSAGTRALSTRALQNPLPPPQRTRDGFRRNDSRVAGQQTDGSANTSHV